MTVRAAWLLTGPPAGQTRTDTRLAPLGTYAPEGELTTRDGVIAGGAPLMAASAGPMKVQIGTGRALVQGTTAQGCYPVAITAPETLTVADGDPQSPRLDSVVLRVYDGLFDASGRTAAAVELLTGTPAPTPVEPPLPASCLRLWTITVAAGASAGTGGINWGTALADRRRYTASYGGIIPRGWGSNFAGSYPGQYRDNGVSLDRWDGSSWQPIAPDVGWTAVTLVSGYTNGGNAQGPVRYRRIDIAGVPHVQWRGGLSWATSGAPPNNAYPLTTAVPSAYRPANLVSVPIAAGGVDIKADFQTGGALRLITSSGVTTWCSLTGVQYPLDA